ncbi:hypothetical protein PPERSA_09484 [Pseudocohnilembus persalinus]|uniref:Uncharacterized protein n=1 Tax=Pseudocohnilembus persalinus TaxID=266149 RepID=A0A0V0QR12_PSEPJ|nr:hypothetical protein PPERSA_09484 [Pseudocohnilembus persalinus]|eukprot:KRX04692.1 hypothetical protein PPERSA_09484 [Pseudocohnilembus persalinus]
MQEKDEEQISSQNINQLPNIQQAKDENLPIYLQFKQYFWDIGIKKHFDLIDSFLLLFQKDLAQKYTQEQIEQRNFMKNVIFGTSLVGTLATTAKLATGLSFLIGIPFNPIGDVILLTKWSLFLVSCSTMPVLYFSPMFMDILESQYEDYVNKIQKPVDLYADTEMLSPVVYYFKHFL